MKTIIRCSRKFNTFVIQSFWFTASSFFEIPQDWLKHSIILKCIILKLTFITNNLNQKVEVFFFLSCSAFNSGFVASVAILSFNLGGKG